MNAILQNRAEAGQLLANKLTPYAYRSDVLVLALPRGGVPVAFEIAKKLHLPLDICLVRKLGVPGRKELAMGAIAFAQPLRRTQGCCQQIASEEVRIINQDVIDSLHIPPDVIERVAREEQQELERRDRVYRGDLPLPTIGHQTIILVDDGIATGSTVKAAIATLKEQQPQAIIVAVPVAPPCVCEELKAEVDQVVCLKTPDSLHSISLWYEDFSQTSDEEVRSLLAQSQRQLISC